MKKYTTTKATIMDEKKLMAKQIGRLALSGLSLFVYEYFNALYWRQNGVTTLQNYIKKNNPEEWYKITQKVKGKD